MNSPLYTYSLIRTLYDQGNDYIDSFWPLIIKVLPLDNSGISLPVLQKKIEEKYGLDIPEHPLKTISTRAMRNGFIERRDKNIYLTSKGKDFYYLRLEPEREAERRVNELLEDARNFIREKHGPQHSLEDIRDTIQAFVVDNLEMFEQFFNADIPPSEQRKDSLTDSEVGLLDYFTNVERTKPIIFRTLQDIVCGSIISAVVHRSEILVEAKKRFEKTYVYLDSNYVFSLLGMSHEEDNKPAKELFKLMKAEGSFEFRVFDFTVTEITNLLRNYEREQHFYQSPIKVRSLFGSLRAKGWTAAKVREFVVNLEPKLWDELGIKLASTDINLRTYQPADPGRRRALLLYKPLQKEKEQNHDLAAIDQIKLLRKRNVSRIENCYAMFLTSDLKLAQFNYTEDDHKDSYTISEVIPDHLLTNILWLKNPSANGKLSLASIIAIHSRQLFIDQTVWKQFYKTVADLRIEGSIDDGDVSILLFDKHIEEVLREFDVADAEKVNPEFIPKLIEDIREKRADDLRFREQAEETAVEIIEGEPKIIFTPPDDSQEELARLREEIENMKRERNERVLDSIKQWKKERELESERTTKMLMIAGTVVVVLLLMGLLLLLFGPVRDGWNQIEPAAWLVAIVLPIVLAVLGVRFDPLNWRRRLRDKIFNRVYRRRLKGLEYFEMNFAVDTSEDES